MSIFEIIITSVTSSVLTMSALAFFLKSWAEKRIEYSIKHSYDKKILSIQKENEIKQKAELVSELLALWLSKPDHKKELNELCFKAFLWLPDDIASELSGLLSHKNNDTDVRKIIQKVRRHLLSDEDTLEDWEVIIFSDEKKQDK